jgi:hypothetical protein
MKQVPIGGARTVKEKKQVSALLTRFKMKPMSKVGKCLQTTQFEVMIKAAIPMKQTAWKQNVNSSEVMADTDVTDQLTLKISEQSNVLETLRKKLKRKIASMDEKLEN